MPTRCTWSESSPLMRAYHDEEWGVPLRDDRRLFEFIVLDTFQAGLSWATVLNKRENFRRAFDDFDAERIARYDDRKIAALRADAGIIRNRQKITATVGNARAYLDLREETGSFADFLWAFVDGRPIQNEWPRMSDVPATSKRSDAMSRALRERGFAFVGSTICYAFMQAAGMVNDHVTSCFRHAEVRGMDAVPA